MAIGLKQHESNVITGLGTYTYTVPSSPTGVPPSPGLWYISAVAQVLSSPSSLSIVINKNGSPIASSTTPSAAQSVIQAMSSGIHFVATDVISVVFSSSAASDQTLNAFKAIVTLNEVYGL